MRMSGMSARSRIRNQGNGMVEGKCKDCKWTDGIKGWDQNEFRSCNHPKMQDEGVISPDCAFGDWYSISVGPEFGCIHWERRP